MTSRSSHKHAVVAQATDDEVVTGLAAIAAKLLVEFVGTWMFVLVILMVTALDPVGALAQGVVIGFAVFALTLIAWGTSGGHFNTYVSLATWLMGYFPGGYSFGSVLLLGGYIGMQILGALVASWTFLRAHPPSIAPTVPNGLLAGDFWGTVLFEFIATTMLILTYLQVMHPLRALKTHWLAALAVGAAYIALIDVLSVVGTGASLNFARTLGPAIVSNTYTLFGAYPLGGVLGVIAAVVLHMLIRCGDDPRCWITMFEGMIRDTRSVTSSNTGKGR